MILPKKKKSETRRHKLIPGSDEQGTKEQYVVPILLVAAEAVAADAEFVFRQATDSIMRNACRLQIPLGSEIPAPSSHDKI